MLESGTRLHASSKKYTPNFNEEIEEEIYLALVKSTEMIEQRDISLTLSLDKWMPSGMCAAVNRILGSNEYYGNQIEPYHNHEFYEINYVKKGTLVQYIDHKKLIMKEGDVLLMSPEVKHASYPVKGSLAYNVLISPDFVKSTEKELLACSSSSYLTYLLKHSVYFLFRNVQSVGADGILDSFLQINENRMQLLAYHNTLCGSFAKQLLILLSQCERMDHAYSTGSAASNVSERSDRILQYIAENYTTVKLETLSELFGYTPQHIRRIILKKTGNNFRMLIQHHRMSHAAKLVGTTSVPIKEICEMVGIDSPEYFSRWFKYQTGHSPVKYRANTKKPPLTMV